MSASLMALELKLDGIRRAFGAPEGVGEGGGFEGGGSLMMDTRRREHSDECRQENADNTNVDMMERLYLYGMRQNCWHYYHFAVRLFQ